MNLAELVLGRGYSFAMRQERNSIQGKPRFRRRKNGQREPRAIYIRSNRSLVNFPDLPVSTSAAPVFLQVQGRSASLI